jgi:predicted nucleic acid-binding Zn ribbon protein
MDRPPVPQLARACLQCSTAYTPKQDYQKFCSPRCRQQAYWARRIRREAERLLAERAPHDALR